VPLTEPPESLTGFPAVALSKASALARVHRADRHPVSFSTSGDGRFDLSPEGTLYLAGTDEGAFVEVFRSRLIPREEVAVRRPALIELGEELALADLTSAIARGFGVTAAIHASPDYALCQRWAAALHAEGFDGVYYRLSHDPSATEVGAALFGPHEHVAQRLIVVDDQPISDELIERVRKRFGMLVLSTRRQS